MNVGRITALRNKWDRGQERRNVEKWQGTVDKESKAKQSQAKQRRKQGAGRSLYAPKIHKIYLYMSTLQMITDFYFHFCSQFQLILSCNQIADLG